MTLTEFDALLDSAAYRDAAQRVVRQLLEALLFEGALPNITWSGDALSIAGTREDGTPVVYRCRARRTASFGRVRIVSPVRRLCGTQESDADDVARVVAELASQLGADPLRLAQFGAELAATHIKDAQTRAAQAGRLLREAGYDEIEAGLTGAHPYHPGYKLSLIHI